MKSLRKIRINGIDKRVITILTVIITVSLLINCLTSCKNNSNNLNEFRLDLANVIETGYGNTVDGDSMCWAIYEEWDNDCERHLLYMDKETFKALEAAVEEYSKAGLKKRDILNKKHKFTLLRDSEGLHICSIR